LSEGKTNRKEKRKKKQMELDYRDLIFSLFPTLRTKCSIKISGISILSTTTTRDKTQKHNSMQIQMKSDNTI
jgi:hypothetical protein